MRLGVHACAAKHAPPAVRYYALAPACSWVCYAEKTAQGGPAVSLLSAVRSPQGIMGVLAKQVLPGKCAFFSTWHMCAVSEVQADVWRTPNPSLLRFCNK